MLMRSIKHFIDVPEWHLCIGCGACYSYCTKDAVELVNIHGIGIRPIIKDKSLCASCDECLSFCPGQGFAGIDCGSASGVMGEASLLFGPSIEMWSGYAVDSEIRHRASSGGVVSALSLYALEELGMHHVLHAGMDPESPWLNRTVTSATRDEVLTQAGSRYAPASPCEGLDGIARSDGQCVFVGKPCDVAATFLQRKILPKLDQNLGLTLSIFCAGTPSTRATLELMNKLNCGPVSAKEIRYRGFGWPGEFCVLDENGNSVGRMPYAQAWSALHRSRPFRCHLCPDGTGMLADISCGDDWYLYSREGDGCSPGHSVILARTDRGRNAVLDAQKKGYISITPLDPMQLIIGQNNLAEKRRQLWGRLLAMKCLMIPTPVFPGLPLQELWGRESIIRRTRTFLGTVKRLIKKGIWRRLSWDACLK